MLCPARPKSEKGSVRASLVGMFVGRNFAGKNVRQGRNNHPAARVGMFVGRNFRVGIFSGRKVRVGMFAQVGIFSGRNVRSGRNHRAALECTLLDNICPKRKRVIHFEFPAKSCLKT